MPNSFATALAGLSAHAIGIDAVGNNLANLNSTAFKSSTVTFRDLVTSSIGIGNEAGLGTALPHSVRYFTQGSIQSSSGPMDAAIKGDGFFVVKGVAQDNLAYTRDGNFRVDANGYLVTLTKERVQGWVASTTGAVNTAGPVADILFPVGALQTPVATTRFSLDLNLDASSPVGAASAFSAPIEIWDSLGVSHVLTATFTKTAPNAWSYTITIPAADLGLPGPAPVTVLAATPITFTTGGTLATPANQAAVVAIPVFPATPQAFASGAAPMTLSWDIFTPTGSPRFTQFAQTSAVASNAQDGSGASQLVKIAMDQGGVIVAQFSNGQQRALAQMAVAAVRNPESMRAIGNNAFQLGPDTSLPAVGAPDSGGRGTILGGALEGSNVDIAREFTNLIILQRGYQANSRVVTTADEISQETINLKR